MFCSEIIVNPHAFVSIVQKDPVYPFTQFPLKIASCKTEPLSQPGYEIITIQNLSISARIQQVVSSPTPSASSHTNLAFICCNWVILGILYNRNGIIWLVTFWDQLFQPSPVRDKAAVNIHVYILCGCFHLFRANAQEYNCWCVCVYMCACVCVLVCVFKKQTNKQI